MQYKKRPLTSNENVYFQSTVFGYSPLFGRKPSLFNGWECTKTITRWIKNKTFYTVNMKFNDYNKVS